MKAQPPKPPEAKDLAHTSQGVKRLKTLLDDGAIKKQFEAVLGKRAPQFISSIVTAVNQNKYLQDCDPMTVIGSAAIAAALDLPINPSLGFAYIVPYKGQATFQMGYKGFIQLAMRSGQYKTINVAIVLEGEIEHRNKFTGEMTFTDTATSDKVVGYVAYFKLLNGFEKYDYMTAEEVLAHAKRFSQAFKQNYGPWKDDFDAMAMKTVLKRALSKYGILSIEMQKAVIDDESTQTDGMTIYPDNLPEGTRDVSPDAPPKKSRLDAIVDTVSASGTQAAASPEPSDASVTPTQNPSPEQGAALEDDKMTEKKT